MSDHLYAIITDTHFGVRSDDPAFADHQEKFYSQVFFPTLKAQGIKNIIHCGDVVERRKFINYVTCHRMKQMFFDPIRDNGMSVTITIGNHDCTYKNTNAINSMDELFDDRPEIQTLIKPVERTLGGTKILFVPWICPDNEKETFDLIEKTNAQVVFGHLEIRGFQMHRGQVSHDGLDPSIFQKFDAVYSGHLHHRHTKGNITYLGSPYETTWHDFEDPRGFHIFDSKSLTMTFVPNPFTMFEKILYDDVNVPNQKFDVDRYAGKVVKVVVINKEDTTQFDNLIESLHAVGVHDLQTVDDHFNLDGQTTEEIEQESKTTIEIITHTINQLDIEPKMKSEIHSDFQSLYNEAIEMQKRNVDI